MDSCSSKEELHIYIAYSVDTNISVIKKVSSVTGWFKHLVIYNENFWMV